MSRKKPKIKAFSVYVPEDLLNKISAIATEEDRTRNQQILRLLKKGVLGTSFNNPEAIENQSNGPE